MKAHVCIGGPLDGEFATTADFWGGYEKVPGTNRNDWSRRIPGMYEHLTHDYVQFHNASRAKGRATVVWIHRPLLPVSIPARQR